MPDDVLTFGPWLQRRRLALHLTQQQLGRLAGCSAAAIRKIEADSRRPSREIAALLARVLRIPEAEHAAFLRFARGERAAAPAVPPVEEPARARPMRPSSNVPAQLTSLIGREADVVAALALLRDDARLVTLTGPGGVGKTRLSYAIAAALRDAFADGTVLVNLAPLTEARLVLSTLAQALEVKQSARQTLLAAVQAHLRDRQLLLLLDNFEQVLDAGVLVAELLQAAPGLTVLVTSRSPLRVRGEHEIAVQPLALPASGVHDLEELVRYDAVRLFVERARAVKLDFQATNTNAQVVAQICARLDGLPLALELAAARVKLLPPDALLQRLDKRLRLLIRNPGVY